MLGRGRALISGVYRRGISRRWSTDLSNAVDTSWSPGDEGCLAVVAIRAFKLLSEVVPADRLRGEGRRGIDVGELSDAGYQRPGHAGRRWCTVACGERQRATWRRQLFLPRLPSLLASECMAQYSSRDLTTVYPQCPRLSPPP